MSDRTDRGQGPGEKGSSYYRQVKTGKPQATPAQGIYARAAAVRKKLKTIEEILQTLPPEDGQQASSAASSATASAAPTAPSPAAAAVSAPVQAQSSAAARSLAEFSGSVDSSVEFELTEQYQSTESKDGRQRRFVPEFPPGERLLPEMDNQDRYDLYQFRTARQHSDARARQDSAAELSRRKKRLQEIFQAGGELSASKPNYKVRPGQLRLAQAMLECMYTKNNLVAEAGTGTGKTFGYLIPALLCQGSTVVSTGSKTLQDQLVTQDIPNLLKMLHLENEVSYFGLKGFANYLCLQRFDESCNEDIIRGQQIQYIVNFILSERQRVQQNPSGANFGDISTQFPSSLRQFLSISSEQCPHGGCPYHEQCFALAAREYATRTDVLVVNHALLMAGLLSVRDEVSAARRDEPQESPFAFLPDFRQLIIDEAHTLPEFARNVYTSEFGSTSVLKLCRQICELFSTKESRAAEAGQDDRLPARKRAQITVAGRSEMRSKEKLVQLAISDMLNYLQEYEGQGSVHLLSVKYRNFDPANPPAPGTPLTRNTEFYNLAKDIYRALKEFAAQFDALRPSLESEHAAAAGRGQDAADRLNFFKQKVQSLQDSLAETVQNFIAIMQFDVPSLTLIQQTAQAQAAQEAATRKDSANAAIAALAGLAAEISHGSASSAAPVQAAVPVPASVPSDSSEDSAKPKIPNPVDAHGKTLSWYENNVALITISSGRRKNQQQTGSREESGKTKAEHKEHKEHKADSSESKSFKFTLMPLDISDQLQKEFESLNKQGRCWAFTSATLSAGNSFDKFLYDTGMAALKPVTMTVETVFDYARQGCFYYSGHFPACSDNERMGKILTTLRGVMDAVRGGIFVLTTSYRSLHDATAFLQQHYAGRRLVLSQDGSKSNAQLIKEFMEDGHAMLVGTSSFWEGVDVPGEALSLVIIDKLPFASPGDPFEQARQNRLQKKGGNPFRQIMLPEAIIALRQGAGRLIRTERDKGGLIICDPRLDSARYARLVLDSLPPMHRASSLQEMTAFFRSL